VKPKVTAALAQYGLVTVVDLLVTYPARVDRRGIWVGRVEHHRLIRRVDLCALGRRDSTAATHVMRWAARMHRMAGGKVMTGGHVWVLWMTKVLLLLRRHGVHRSTGSHNTWGHLL